MIDARCGVRTIERRVSFKRKVLIQTLSLESLDLKKHALLLDASRFNRDKVMLKELTVLALADEELFVFDYNVTSLGILLDLLS
jgi:hypothetical protein